MDTPFGSLPDRHLASMSMADRHETLRRQAVSRRSFLRASALGGAVLLGGPTLWRQTARASAPPTAPHLQLGADPRRSVVVSWSTVGNVARPVVEIGVDESFGRVIDAETRTVAGTDTHYHHAVVEGLEPATTYRYRVGHDGVASAVSGVGGSLRTAPDGPVPFTFTSFGDQGVSDGARATTAVVAAQDPAFHFHVGDLCYAYSAGGLAEGPTNQAVWDEWFALVSGGAAASVPWMPTVGNHEMESGYGAQGYDGVLARFSLPSQTGAPGMPVTYAVRWGNVALVALDANDVSHEITANTGYSGGAQDAWLAATLLALRADPAIDWIVVGYHHCSYCTNAVHASDGGPRERWGALFDTAGVDLVLNGHNHCYERTHPLRAGAVTAEVPGGSSYRPADAGTTYLTVGGGGQAAYQAALHPLSYVTVEGGARLPEEAPWSATRYLDLSLVAVDVSPPDPSGATSLTVRALSAAGNELERVTLLRTKAASVPAPLPVAADTAATPTAPAPLAAAPARSTAVTLPATGGRAAVGTAALTAAVGAAGLHLARRSTPAA